jgi:hypothetical protein
MADLAHAWSPMSRLPPRDYLTAAPAFRTFTMHRKGDPFKVHYPSLHGIYALGPTAYRRYLVTAQGGPWIVTYPDYEVHPVREMVPFIAMLAGAATSALVVASRSIDL